jgi:hypothetical protein
MQGHRAKCGVSKEKTDWPVKQEQTLLRNKETIILAELINIQNYDSLCLKFQCECEGNEENYSNFKICTVMLYYKN